MPSTFCFTHPPHFHFFSLTYGPVVVVDFDLDILLVWTVVGMIVCWWIAKWPPPTSPSLCCCCFYHFLTQSFCCDFLCCYWCHVLEKVFIFSLDVVWLSANGLLSAPALTSPRPQNSNAQCFNSTKHTKNRTQHFNAIQQWLLENCSMQMHKLNERKCVWNADLINQHSMDHNNSVLIQWLS